MAAKQVVGLFSSMNDAQAAVQDLRDAGIPGNDISLVARNTQGSGTTTTTGEGSRVGEDAGKGAVTGGVLGGLGGLLVGLGALAIPGIGPVIAGGTLAAALGTTAAGAGIGAASGGLIGALVGAGVPEEDANVYTEGVRRGGALVTVQTNDDAMASQAADIMDRHNVQDIDNLGRDYRSSGWSRFDAGAGDYNSGTTTTRDASYTGDQTSSPEGSGLGTGVGTLSGAATGAAIGSVGGPIGTVIGGVAGALTGAGVGKAADKVGAEVAGDSGDYSTATPGTTTHDTSRIGSVTDTSYSTPGMTETTRTTDTSYTGSAPVNADTNRTTETTNTGNAGYVGVAKDNGEFVVPVVEEQINIAKQQVEGGGVRVQTHVTETPVNEQVSLHEEQVHVERRPVNQPVDGARIDQLREGTFEVREMSEQAVVSKQARVVEEVVINKEAHERTENIQDTVRRTDVNVEELPAEMRPTGYTETVNTSTSSTQGMGYNTTSRSSDVADSGMNRAENAAASGMGQAENAASRTANAAGNVLDRAAGAVERGAEDVTGSDLNKSGGVGDHNV
ncbi:MAG: DUF2382 domain-containing protein [Herpetosiphonaceae bacterium]|nr:DUF2382 domain-containing protein [Herpetosiphonaceae bacterium]